MGHSAVLAPTAGLHGPHAEDARNMVELSRSLSYGQAVELGAMWEYDDNPKYNVHCEAVQEALALSGRELPLGWFEAVFEEYTWLTNTKALHAIADAVVATLVKDEVPSATFKALVDPWWKYMSRNALHKVDLRKMREICTV
jgi:hypothetical protein